MGEACYNISMYSRRIIALSGFSTLFLYLAPTLASAAIGLVPIVPDDCNGLGGCTTLCDLAQMAQNTLNDGIYIAVFLAAILFAWAGFRYLTSVAGSDISAAKKIFSDVIIGLVIILTSWLIVDTLMKTLVGGNIGPWNQIC